MEQRESTYQFKEQAVPFIIYNGDNGEFEMSGEAKEMFSNLNGPFGVVSVAGMYRTGKSYLLNKVLLDRKKDESGFGVGPSVNPCTKGLWVWGTPIPGYSPDGKEINILIIDSEGIGALDEDSNHDTKIFSLCILLSSFFLYNSMGSIDESALQNLNLVVNLTKHIHLKSNSNQDEVDSEEYSEYFPSFMWIVRDFTLQLVDADDENINANQYLEKALEEQNGFSDKIEEKNRIRRLLKTFFRERQCYTMIRPVTNEDSLQNLDTIGEEHFRSDFIEQVVHLRRKVIHCVKPKTLNGKMLNPTMFITLAESYVSAINKGAVPNIENAWAYICQNESQKSLEKAVIHFDEFLSDAIHKLPLEETELREMYKEKKLECIDIFSKSSVGGVINDHMEELKFQLQMKFDKILQENERECVNLCNQFLDTEYPNIDNKLKRNEYEDFYEFENDLKEFKNYYYNEAPSGPMRNECLLEFMNERLVDSIDHFIRRLTSKIELDMQLSQEQIGKLESQIDELKRLRTQDRDESDDKIKELSLQKAKNIANIKSLEESLKTEQETFNQRESEIKQKMKKDKSDLERKLEILKNREEDAKKRENEKNLELMGEQSSFSKEKALLEQKIEYLEKTLAEMREKQEMAMQEFDEDKETSLQTYRDKQNEFEQRISDLTEENESLKEELATHQERIQKICKEYQEQIEEMQHHFENSANNTTFTDDAVEELKEDHRQKIEDISAQFKEIQDDLTEKFINSEELNKKLQQEFNTISKEAEKDKAISQQKITFLNNEVEVMKEKVLSKEKEHQEMLQFVGSNQDDQDE